LSNFGSLLEIFFKDSEFFPLIFQQQLTTLDFVSYCGSLMGLFLGFSVISAIEVVYYFTLRIFCAKKQSKKVTPLEVTSEPSQDSYLTEVLQNSSIHGFNQTAKSNRHIFERFEQS
jgi:hypothetical protein